MINELIGLISILHSLMKRNWFNINAYS